jgi:hypothetical protein
LALSNNPILSVTVDESDRARVEAALSRVTWRSIDLSPALAVAGEAILDIFKESFEREETPEGEPWPELAASTQAGRIYGRRRSDASARARRGRARGRIRGGEHILQAQAVPGWLLRDLGMEVGQYDLSVGELKPSASAYYSEFDAEGSRAFVEATDKVQDILGDELLKWLGDRWV